MVIFTVRFTYYCQCMVLVILIYHIPGIYWIRNSIKQHYFLTCTQDDAPPIAATVITITTLAYVTFGLRIYTRTTRKNWGREDYIMTVALVSLLSR